MHANKQTRQTIVRLLSSMASAKEISQYLKRFSQLDAKRFAVVKVGGAVLRDDLEALTSSLSFLQEVGLTPIVLHGAGPQLDAELSAAGIEKQTVNGLRVTSPEALESTGFWDYPLSDGIFVIEWAENILDCLPENCIRVTLSGSGDEPRTITVERDDDNDSCG
jgi:acetylglutamate synthase